MPILCRKGFFKNQNSKPLGMTLTATLQGGDAKGATALVTVRTLKNQKTSRQDAVSLASGSSFIPPQPQFAAAKMVAFLPNLSLAHMHLIGGV